MSRPSIPPLDTASTTTAQKRPGSLTHPLPAGMRDLLPAEAEAQGRLAAGVLRTFDLHGYQRVNLPAFEYADVLERGLGMIEPTSVLRFVEPETGEVVALRPDMTPQVARLVSTRLADLKGPVRVCYRGSVLRRQHERARHDQQMLQAGIELVGGEGPDADLEVISVCTKAVTEQGLSSYVLDLGHGGVATALLEGVPAEARDELIESLSLKDGAELSRRVENWGLAPEIAKALVALVGLQGGEEVFERARSVLENTPAWPHVEELRRLYVAVVAAEIAKTIVIDLGETRGRNYYTGPTFQILAEGPGQAVASGGRYDSLYGLFGNERAALGGAIQLDHLRWALGSKSDVKRVRAVIVDPGQGSPLAETAAAAAATLRAAGISCVFSPEVDALDYAQAWRYSHLVRSLAEAIPYRVSVVDTLSAPTPSASTPSASTPSASPPAAPTQFAPTQFSSTGSAPHSSAPPLKNTALPSKNTGQSSKETDLGTCSVDQLVKQLRP